MKLFVALSFVASELQELPWIRVVETAMVPTTRIAGQMYHPLGDGKTEPIGNRIIEVPENDATEPLRDPHSGFIAYVPPGAIARGEALVKTGGAGKTVPCALCHGETLHGLGEVPRLAGLQPLYIARQLFDLQYGSSAGKAAQLMKRAVAQLSEDDIIAISAYLGSLPPR